MTAEHIEVAARAAATSPAVDLFLVSGRVGGLNAAAALRSASEYAVAAEQAGFDAIWLAEHHFVSYGACPSAVAFAAYLLGRTHRITVGTAAAILSTRHPVALAEEALLLDIVSGGRFALGVARGGPWVDLEVFGTGWERYENGFAESLDLLLRAMSGAEPISAAGPSFAFRPVTIVPPPTRPVPVWVAATSAATATLAASRGLPLLLGLHDDLHAKAAMLKAYAQPCEQHASAHLVSFADEARLRPILSAWLARTAEYQRLGPAPSASRDIGAYIEHLLRLHPPGSAAQHVDRLATAVEETGVGRLMLLVEAGEPGEVVDAIHRLGSEVLPALKAARPA